MNQSKKFDLSRVNFKKAITAEVDETVVAKHKSFYRVQMEFLKKIAESWDLEEDTEEHIPYQLHTDDDFDVLSWSAAEDMSYEYFPHQIVLVLRLTKPAI